MSKKDLLRMNMELKKLTSELRSAAYSMGGDREVTSGIGTKCDEIASRVNELQNLLRSL